MKKTYYFQHDFGARNDDKIIALRMTHGWLGYGLFWAVIEKLWENGGQPLPFQTVDTMVYEFRCDKPELLSIIKDFDLFVLTDTHFHSKSLLDRVGKMVELQGKRAAAGSKGGKTRVANQNAANGMTTDDHYRN